MRKRENAGDQHFFIFPQCFQPFEGQIYSLSRIDESKFFYAPMSIDQLGYSFCPVCLLSIYQSARNLNAGHNLGMVSDRAYIFHSCVLRGKTFSLVPRLKSSVKVKYQGHVFRKMTVMGEDFTQFV